MQQVILFAPRYHPNLRFWIEAGNDAGLVMKLWVLYRGKSEWETQTMLEQIGYSSIWYCLCRKCKGDAFDDVSRKYGLPGLSKLWSLLVRTRAEDVKPVVVIRNINAISSLVVYLGCRIVLRSRIVLYSQGPCHRRPTRLRRFVNWLLFDMLGHHGFTPVLGSKSEPRSHAKIHYVPFAHPPLVRPEDLERRARNSAHILMVGKFTPRKRHALLVCAFARMRVTNATLTLVGEVSTRQHINCHQTVVKLIRQLGLEKCVRVIVNVPKERMECYYHEADMLAMPSVGEPAAFSVVEAMAYGLPVFTSTENGTSCYVDQGVSGEVLPPDDLDAWTEALSRWCSDSDLRRAGGLAALHRCAKCHDGSAFVRIVKNAPLNPSGTQFPGLPTGE